MKNTILSLLFLYCLACNASERNLSTDSPQKIKILTYNVNYGNPRIETMKIIDSLDADIVCLQETTEIYEKLATIYLSKKYNYISFKHCCNAGGLAILSKFPVVRNEYLNNDIGWFPAWVIEIKTPEGAVQLLNVHLKPGLNRLGKVGFLGKEYFKAQKTHISELGLFLKFLTENYPTFILGDFNENDKGKAIKWLIKINGYKDSLSQFDKKSNTWKWGILKGRFDHIIHNNQIKCIDASVCQCGFSDHFPVVGVYMLTSSQDKK